MCATRDSLFVFKEDGIWRLSGVGGTWRVDPFDLTTFCVLPSSIQRMDNSVFMLSNKGVVRVNENGVEILSQPVRDVVATLVDDCQRNFRAYGYYSITGVPGRAAMVDGRNSEYHLLVGDNVLPCGGDALVFNDASAAWTTNSYGTEGALGFEASALAVDAYGVPWVMHAGGVRQALYVDTLIGDENVPITSDGWTPTTVTISSTASAELTIAPDVVASAGDVIRTASGNSYQITGRPSAGTLTLRGAPVPSADALGSAVIYRAITCTVQPHGFADAMVTGKMWTGAAFAFSRLVGPLQMLATFSSAAPTLREADQLVSEELHPARVAGVAGHFAGTLLKTLVPRLHARGWLMRASLSWVQAFGRVALELFYVESRDGQKHREQSNASGDT
jgi:hypothetical protein